MRSRCIHVMPDCRPALPKNGIGSFVANVPLGESDDRLLWGVRSGNVADDSFFHGPFLSFDESPER